MVQISSPCFYFLLFCSHKFICEISQNVMYQYIILVIWFFMVLGIGISIASFLHMLSQYAKAVFWMHNPTDCRESMSGKIHSLLTLREIEYLEVIKASNLALYGEVLRELTKARPDLFALTKYFNHESSYLARHVWKMWSDLAFWCLGCSRSLLTMMNMFCGKPSIRWNWNISK